MAMTYTKGTTPMPANYARGGPPVTSVSRFMKAPNVFLTSIERQDYEKTSKGGEMSKLTGDKSEKTIKPRT